MRAEERTVDLDGRTLRYLAAGEGPPLLLLHGAGDSSFAWSWGLPELAGGYRVYAPTLPGIGDGARFPDRSSTAYASLISGFMDVLGIERAALTGNSLGSLIGLRLSLSDSARVSALVLVDSTGLGRVINPAFTSVNVPGLGEASIPWWRTPAGACRRAWGRAAMLFARPANAPQEWLAEQQRLALLPGHLEAHLAALRAHIHPGGQREVLVDRLSHLQVPALVLWGARDRVLPAYQARQAVARLPKGRLEIIPECGHLSHVECPGDFLGAVGRFSERESRTRRTRQKGTVMTMERLKPVGEQVVALMSASSGIGRETALRLAGRGARVVVSARSEEGLNSLDFSEEARPRSLSTWLDIHPAAKRGLAAGVVLAALVALRTRS